jgi:hypothetical protein
MMRSMIDVPVTGALPAGGRALARAAPPRMPGRPTLDVR